MCRINWVRNFLGKYAYANKNIMNTKAYEDMMEKYGIQVFSLGNKKEIDELERNITNFDNVRMKALFDTLKFPITIVYEKYYVDKLFRDTYYKYFSSKHFEISRTCERLTLFEGDYSYEQFLNDSFFGSLQSAIIGMIVFRPTNINIMGRTLLDPNKMHLGKMYVRTAEFEISLLGKLYKIQAYPFMSQDTETMTCAETSIWTMFEYFGTRYPEYRTVLPSEIIDELGDLSEERVLPSQGLNFRQKSSLLKKFGFYPRVYTENAYGQDFRRFFHYYVESGIPITLSLPGHSVVCIGHAAGTYNIKESELREIASLKYIDSSSFIEKYVIVDDNKLPYSLDEYGKFSAFEREMTLFTVPLYRRIFLEVNDASTIFDCLLKEISPLMERYINSIKANAANEEKVLIKRIFLTSFRKYKTIRSTNAISIVSKKFYSEILMPKFIWVCEIATCENYKKKRIDAELVLDATASRYDQINSTILIRIGDNVGYRMPDENFIKIVERLKCKISNFDVDFKMYENNLQEVVE